MTATINNAIAQVNTDQTGLNWYDRATAGGWNITSNSCQIICPVGYERVDKDNCRKKYLKKSCSCNSEGCECQKESVACSDGDGVVVGGSCDNRRSRPNNNRESQTETTYDTDGDGYTDSYRPNSDGSHYGSAHNTMGFGSSTGGPGNQGANNDNDNDDS